MDAAQSLESSLDQRENELILSLNGPAEIQAFLDEIPYSADPIYRSPVDVLRDRKAHCVDGALLAAALLRRLGYPPLVLELFAERDDDHFLALYKQGRCWGAVAKSNFVGLRFREPIYRTPRELALSYFEFYYNIEGVKTLRRYTVPVDMRAFDRLGWEVCADNLETIIEHIDRRRSYPVIEPSMASHLAPVDRRSYEAGMLGINMDGIYRP